MKYLYRLLIIALWVLIIVGVPLALIDALNVLFGFGIPFTLETWGACFILIAIVKLDVVIRLV